MIELKYDDDILDSEKLFQYIKKANTFYNNRLRRRLKYNGKKIDFGNHMVEICGERIYSQFLHIASFSDDNFFKDVPRPCSDTEYYETCENCVTREYVEYCNAKKRAWCLYRISLMPLIIEIFKDIRENSIDNITILEKSEYKKSLGKNVNYVHIRFVDKKIYYYIKLQEVEDKFRGNYYSFVCGYPVFYSEKKKDFDRLFLKAKK